MGLGYLLDTNSVIDYLGNKFPEKCAVFLDNIKPNISVITRIEVLGWLNATSDQLERLGFYIQATNIFPLEEDIILKTIEIRQRHRIRTPDAVIAATAIVHGFTLVTRNISDFKSIDRLVCIDLYQFE